jgi:hypothetical protein
LSALDCDLFISCNASLVFPAGYEGVGLLTETEAYKKQEGIAKQQQVQKIAMEKNLRHVATLAPPLQTFAEEKDGKKRVAGETIRQKNNRKQVRQRSMACMPFPRSCTLLRAHVPHPLASSQKYRHVLETGTG